MTYKGKYPQEEFFNRLIKTKCKFKRFGNIYACNCKKALYIGIKADYKQVEVFEINEEESKFFRALIKIFKDPVISVQDFKNMMLQQKQQKNQ